MPSAGDVQLPLSRKQLVSIADSEARLNIWEGSVRSGKTIASLIRWLVAVSTAPRTGELVMFGRTRETIGRNCLAVLQNPAIFGKLARYVRYTAGAQSANILGRTVHVIGANDAKAEPKVRGMTVCKAYGDELTTLPADFFKQMLARLSVPGAQLFGTTNPDNPAHWLRQDFLLRADKLDLASWHFTLDDNPSLDPAYVASLKAEYVGLWYKRFIEGQWVMAEGAIYDTWDADRHVVSEIPEILHWLSAGIDYGTTNPFAGELVGLGVDRRLHVVSEYRYSSRQMRRALTDAEYSVAVREWLAGVKVPAQGNDYYGVQPQLICVDPSAASFITQMRRDGIPGVVGANNEVLHGIRTVASLFAAGAIDVHESCTGLINEIPGYSWDEKAQEKGEDKPIKADDHHCDGLRYGVKTPEAAWRPVVQLNQRRAA